MASDGEFIYTLVHHFDTSFDQSKRKSCWVETYSFTDNMLKFENELKLTDENRSNWIGRKSDK